jgi:hypothetical protein
VHRLWLVLLIACSSKPTSATTGSGVEPAATATVNLEDVVASNAIGVARFVPSTFLPLTYVKELRGETSPCWEALEKTLVAGYQIELDVTPRNSYFILEGAFPRAAVIDCIPRAIRNTKLSAKLDGELVAITPAEEPQHPAYVGLRGQFAVIGTKQQVEAALQTPTAETRARWQAVRVAQPATAPVWMARGDRLLTNLFGVDTTGYVFVLDKVQGESFAGRVIATYKNAGDAAVAARRIKQGELQTQVEAPATLLTSFKRMTVKQSGVTVELGFNLDTFGGLSADELQQWVWSLNN